MKIELSHDILARKIYEKASSEDKILLKMENVVRQGFVRYEERKILMSKDDYDYVIASLELLTLTSAERSFVAKSGEALAAKKRQNNIIILFIILSLLGLAAYATYQSFLARGSADAFEAANVQLRQQSMAIRLKNDSILAKNAQIEKQRRDLEDAYALSVQAQIEAQNNYHRAELLRREAERNAEKARQQTIFADSLRAEAQKQTSAALYQKSVADSLRLDAQHKFDLAVRAQARADSLLTVVLKDQATKDSLRVLSEARLIANKAIRSIQGGAIVEGVKLALLADSLNTSNNGSPQNPDIYSALDMAYKALDRINQTPNNYRQLSSTQTAAVRCLATAYNSQQKSIIAFAAEDRELTIIDQNETYNFSLDGRPRAIHAMPKGEWILVGMQNGVLEAFEYEGGEYRRRDVRLMFQGKRYRSNAAISFITTVQPFKDASEVRIIMTNQRGTMIGNLQSSGNDLLINVSDYNGYKDIQATAVSDDGKYVWLSDGNSFQVIRLTYNDDFTISYQNQFNKIKKGKVVAAAIGKTPNNEYLVAVGFKNGSVKISNIEDITCFSQNENCRYSTQTEHQSPIARILFNQSCTQLVSASLDRTARIWSLEDIYDESIPLIGHRQWIWDIAYSGIEDEIYSVSEDRSIKTWVASSDLLNQRLQSELARASSNNKNIPNNFRAAPAKNRNKKQ